MDCIHSYPPQLTSFTRQLNSDFEDIVRILRKFPNFMFFTLYVTLAQEFWQIRLMRNIG